MPLQLFQSWAHKIISANSCYIHYQSNQIIISSAASQERLIFKANYILPENKNMNSYVGDILLLVQIPLALAFTSVHYFLNQYQTGIDRLLRLRRGKIDQILVTFEISNLTKIGLLYDISRIEKCILV